MELGVVRAPGCVAFGYASVGEELEFPAEESASALPATTSPRRQAPYGGLMADAPSAMLAARERARHAPSMMCDDMVGERGELTENHYEHQPDTDADACLWRHFRRSARGCSSTD